MARMERNIEMAERLMNSYALEADIYEQLLGLSRKQGQLLEESGDVDTCAVLFDRKDELLRAIADVEREIEPLKRRWWSEEVEPQAREQLNGVLDTILSTIESLMAQEQRNEQLLTACHSEVEAELGHIQRGSAMHRTQVDDQPQPRFMDISH